MKEQIAKFKSLKLRASTTIAGRTDVVKKSLVAGRKTISRDNLKRLLTSKKKVIFHFDLIFSERQFLKTFGKPEEGVPLDVSHRRLSCLYFGDDRG